MTPRPGALSATASRAFIYAAFFASGASSLVFQAIWSRLLHHVLGSSSLAISSVVSVFMAGLGAGAYWVGKRADGIRRPLLYYALAELGIGLASLAVPWVMRAEGWLAGANAALRAELGAGSLLFFAARFGCIVPVLLVPTFLMGATLPLLARHAVSHASSSADASRQVGQLYAVNTLGAVLGVLASSFVLLPRIGVHATNATAAGVNFILAGTVLVLLRWVAPRAAAPGSVDVDAPHELRALEEPSAGPTARRAAMLAFAFSGFASLLCEVVWSRALVATIGGSLYAFSLIVATFLLGIALGSALASWLAGERRRAHFTLLIAGSALSLIAAAPMMAVGRMHLAWLAGLTAVVSTLGLAWFGQARSRRDRMLASEQTASPVTRVRSELSVAPLVALGLYAWMPTRLGGMTASVIVACAALLWLLHGLRDKPLWLLAALQFFIGAATFASDVAADELALTFASMVLPLHDSLPDHVGAVQALMCATAALCVLPAALGMGAVFPVALRVWSAGGSRIGADVGVFYTGNTLGSIVGAWLPGFVLMPWIGLQATLHVGIATNLCVATALAGVAAWSHRAAGSETSSLGAARIAAAVMAGVLLLWAVATLRPNSAVKWDISKMTLGAFRLSLARDVLDEEAWGAPDVVFHRDGLSTTVTVERWGRHYSLKNNGKVDASNGDDMPTQILVAALPLLMHPRGPEGLDVSVIGFGSGVTVGAALQFPIASLEVVELEAATVEASRLFAPVNHLRYTHRAFPYVSEPRLTVFHDDGRNYLAASRKRYDVIVSEPSNPWLTGVSDLFTFDHFQVAKRRLAPSGVYCQWVQLYEISPQNVKSLYRTFAASFAHVAAFSPGNMSSDTILIGSDQPLSFDIERLRSAMQAPRVACELRRAGVDSPYDVLARTLLANRTEVLRFTHGAELNTDDNARVELSAPRDLIGFKRFRGYLQSFFVSDWPYARVAGELTGFGVGVAASQSYAQQALSLLAHGRKGQAADVLAAAQGAGDSESLTLARTVHAGLTGQAPTPGIDVLSAADAISADATAPAQAVLASALAECLRALARGDHSHALSALRAAPPALRRAEGGYWDYLEGALCLLTGDNGTAMELLGPLAEHSPALIHAHPSALYFLARAQDASTRFAPAVSNLLAYMQMRE